MPKKFDQEAKGRVVRLIEDRIWAENMSLQAACKAVASKYDVSLAYGPPLGPAGS